MENSASCIDLILTNQPNLVIDSGVHPSLHTNCHHKIVYCKLNLNIKFPPPYERLVWHYNKADTEKVKKSIEQVHWENIIDRKNPHQQVVIFNKTIINIFSNFAPNRLITCDDRDPPWINEFVKNKIKWKNKIYKDYVKNGRTENDYFKLQIAINDVSEIIDKRRNDYNCHLASKLNTPKANAKTYWSILKSFYIRKKIPPIPPLLHNDMLITDFKQKADLFDNFFAA